jgi:hypothetical protein
MNRISMFWVLLWLGAMVILNHASLPAQQAGAGIAATPAQTAAPNVISFSESLANQPDGALTATFALYPDQQSTNASWTETQVVQVNLGKYTVLLGSTSADGIPASVFAAEQAHWLGVQLNGTEKRYLLVSVPYAMKAMEAERLGGLLPSDFVTTQQLQTILLNSTSSSGSAGKGGTGPTAAGPIPAGPTPAASTNPPQPATDFTDNNSSEVLLITQQGTGFAIHAVSAGDAAVFAENNTATGTALKAVATGTTGANIGILGQSASSAGIAATFDNTGGGQILSLRSNGSEVASVDNFGNFKANKILGFFSGDGSQLANIPPSAVGAQSTNVPNTIVVRDAGGNFAANKIIGLFSGDGSQLANIPPAAVGAQSTNVPNTIVVRDAGGNFAANKIIGLFSGDGSQLANIPPAAVGAQSTNVPNTIVVRDAGGNFAANKIIGLFSGDGSQLSNIPPAAVGAQSTNVPNSVVARDQNGGFSAGLIFGSFAGDGSRLFNIQPSAVGATTNVAPNSVVERDQNGSIVANAVIANGTGFAGNGFGLTNIPNSATSATNSNTANAIVARDANGGFSAATIQATSMNLFGGFLTNLGLTDFSNGANTSPVRALLSANTPATCNNSRELLIKTDATPGQQLFICNATGNGWILVGDGSGFSSNVTETTTSPITTFSQLGSGDGVTVSSTTGTAVFAQSATGTAIHGDSNSIGIEASSQAIGLWAAAEASDSSGTSLLLSNASLGKLIRGGVGTGPALASESFSVDASGNMSLNGAVMAPYAPTGTWFANSLVKLAPAPGFPNSVAVTMTTPGDTSGAIGIITGLPVNGAVEVALGGTFPCNFDGLAQAGDYVGISHQAAGQCTDLGPSFPTNGTQVVGRVNNVYTSNSSMVLLFGPEHHAGSNVTFSLTAADPSVAIGGTTAAPTIEVANGGITSAKLAPNAVTSANISNGSIANAQLAANAVTSVNLAPNAVTSANVADGSLPAAKITGTAATLGANTFTDVQTMPSLNVTSSSQTLPAVNVAGFIQASGIVMGGSGGSIINSDSAFFPARVQTSTLGVGSTNLNSMALLAESSTLAIEAAGFGFQSTAINAATNGDLTTAIRATVNGNQSAAGVFVNAQLNGSILSGQRGSSHEVFNVDTVGNVFSAAGQTRQFPSIALSTVGLLAKLDSNGNAVTTVPGDTGGVVGIVVSNSGAAGPRIAYAGTASCIFDNQPHTLDYVQISASFAGECTDVGPSYPSSGQVIGRVWQPDSQGGGTFVLLSGADQQGFSPGIATINITTGPGLTGGPITGSGTISIGNNAVTNSMLQNSTVAVNPGVGLSGGGTAALGGSVTLNNTGTLSFNGRAGNVVAAPGDYSFSQLSGSAIETQLPATAVVADRANTFTSGTQDFSGAGATLPVRALTSAQTPSTCVPSKELLIKTDAPAGQQLFICDGGGATWNLVGDGASGGVVSFNGRNGTVSTASGDYSFSQISGSVSGSQMPALTGDVSSSAGTTVTVLVPSGVAAGTYSKVSVDLKGRVVSGTQAAFSDLAGSATQSQLPVNVVYNNQVNTFSANQTINGSLSATLFTGNGGGLSNVNAATLNNLASSSFAQLGTNNTFNGSVNATSFSGNGSGLTGVNASTVNGLQMLKVSASLTPSSVGVQSCLEQAFTVSGINAGDVLLAVLQPSNHSPGTNIAIGGWRVSADSTVNIQFCNVSRSASTPVAGTYTFALMR